MIAFEHPAVLLALLPLAPLCAWRAGHAARAAARAALAASLLAAAAGPHRERTVELRGPAVVARDEGSGVRPGEMDLAPRGELSAGFERGSAGILRAAALAGPGGAVVLATPARWDAAEAAEAVRAAGQAGVPVYLWSPPDGPPDAAVTAVRVPVAPVENEPFEILASVEGVPAARGEAVLLVDNAPAGRRACDAPRALLRFTATLPAGIHSLAVRFETPSDAERRNNVALGLVEVRGAPRVLVVEGAPGAGGAAAAALEAQGIPVERERAGGAPAWGDFAAVVLARVDPAAIGAPEALAEAVASGTGLLAVVGPAEAAAWGRHPLGALLPIALRSPDPSPPSPEPGPDKGPPAPSDESPRILLLLVLDRSGSMAGTKIQAAKEAAIASAATLAEGDRVGVVAFDSEAHWLLEPVDASARGTIADAISRLQPGGETDIYKGLEAAGKRARGQKVPVRHVILMTDGQTPSADFRALVQDLAADGVTVSTVGIGQDFDGDLLANIAQWGKGRFYFTSRSDEIPRLFTLESRRIAAGAPAPRARPSPGLPPPPRTLEFLPVLAAEADPATDGLAGWPSIAGACGEEARRDARLLLKAGARPLLAVRRASLGRVAAFAAPLDGPEAARWAAWERFPPLAAQLVR
ncbi:MAG: VWA domain-containing protein, partial [Planctomycetia bacterium]|nr:VWA domain-containing protein [Planctomycetia bacterium]